MTFLYLLNTKQLRHLSLFVTKSVLNLYRTRK